jgi:hypothetical protein
MEVDYYSKYLKYKSKYLELLAQIGGRKKCQKDIRTCVGDCSKCKCISFGPKCCKHSRNLHYINKKDD